MQRMVFISFPQNPGYKMETLSIGYALLATQNALLYVVTPELRAVVIDVCKKKEDIIHALLL